MASLKASVAALFEGSGSRGATKLSRRSLCFGEQRKGKRAGGGLVTKIL